MCRAVERNATQGVPYGYASTRGGGGDLDAPLCVTLSEAQAESDNMTREIT